MKKTLAVIVPVYNTVPYLRRCLDSILAQTRLPDEIICVDDGSTDDSGKILDEYATKLKNIRVIHKVNGGNTSARKIGVKASKCDYVTFVDSDDWIEPNMYEEMMYEAETNRSDIVTSGIFHDYARYCVEESERAESGEYSGDKLTYLKRHLVDEKSFFRRNIHFHLVNKLFKKEEFEKIQSTVDDDITIGEDLAVSYPFILNANSCFVTGKSYYHYCARGDSTSNSKINNKFIANKMLLGLKEYYVSEEEVNPSISKQYEIIGAYIRLLNMPEEVFRYENGMLFPFGRRIPEKSRIVLYGMGSFGQQAYRYICENLDFEVVARVDKSVTEEGVISPESIANKAFDFILITVLLADVVENIISMLQKIGIDKEKIIAVSV